MRPGYSLMGNYNRLPEVTMKMTTVKKGCKGEAVKQLQMLLGINADGIFGPKTKAAVIAYQTAHNLKPDGICGPLTWASLQGETIPASAHVKPVDYKQYDSKWAKKMYSSHGDKSQTMKNSACGPTAMADIVATLIDSKVTPPDLAGRAR